MGVRRFEIDISEGPMDQVVTAFDLERMFIGDEPPLFFLEIIFRTAIIYVYTLVLLRWLGSRTVGQLSTVEFLLVIALGSAVGDSMFYPDVPLLQAMLVITLVVFANKALDMLIARSPRAERIVDGAPCEAIRDGALSPNFIKSQPMSRDELFQQLRGEGVEQLGEVRRAYIEKDGRLTVFLVKGDAPRGLPIVPPPQLEAPTFVDPTSENAVSPVCTGCGSAYRGCVECQECKERLWTSGSFAVL